jgi:tetratricopeptide (TPR) repeat protein
MAFETTVKLAPAYARAWYNLGLARSTAGDLAGAIIALLQAEGVDPNDPRAPYARATILARQGKTAEARTALQRALAIQSHFPPALELMRRLSG